MDGDRKLRPGSVLFPRVTQLDLTGPYEVLARLPELEIFLVPERASQLSLLGIATTGGRRT
jgi:hypothetical protein